MEEIHINASLSPRRRRRWQGIRMSCRRVLFFCVSCILGAAFVFGLRSRSGESVPRNDVPIWGLPSDATNVSFHVRAVFGPITAYEFDTSEKEFLKWAKRNRWDVTRVSGRPYRIGRYTGCVGKMDEPLHAVICDGYSYEWTESDMGIYVAFDRDRHRAYFFDHSR